MKKINEIIKYYIQRKSINEFLVTITFLLLSCIIIFISITILESIFFFEKQNKLQIILLLTPIVSSLFIYAFTKFTLQYFSLFKINNEFNIAKNIGKEFSNIKDQLLNVLQITNQKNSTNLDLKNYAAENLIIKLTKIAKSKITFNLPKLLSKTLVAVTLLTITLLLNNSINDAAYRIINYNTHFQPPAPFTLESIKKNVNILSSDSLEIEITGIGKLPDSITFYWVENNIKNKENININNNAYNFQFNKISSDIIYWADYTNEKFFSSWDKISTAVHSVHVKQRPIIENISFTITPPAYTKQEQKKYKLINNNQINMLKGSKVIINASSDKYLDSSWILSDKKRIDLNTTEKKISAELYLTENMIFSIHCLDKNYIPNLSVKQYNFIINSDLEPNISIQSPNNIFEIDETMIIPIVANINDDYGLTNVIIQYEVISSDFLEFNNNTNDIIIKSGNFIDKSLNLNMNWEIQSIPISMGDELHFKIIAKDNNFIDGYQTSESPILIGKFPDIEDLFAEIDELEYETEEIVNDIESSLEEISDIAEDLKMELLKSDKPNWEQEKRIEETFDEINDIANQIEQIQDNINEILEKADKNQLFSEELMSKFEKFQNLLDNMMSEELFDAMQNLQDALQELDMEKITEALDNFNFNIEQFEEQIDRYIDMFETAMAEQKLNELYEHIENMIDKQNNLIEELNNNQNEYVLSKKSNKQEKRYQDFQNLLNETINSLQKINKNTSNTLNDISSDSIINETQDILEKQTESIGENDVAGIVHSAKNNMSNIAEMINDAQNQFQNEITKKLTKEFIIIIDNLLTISNLQEKLIQQSKTVRSNSPNIKIINREQDKINRQLDQITKQLIDLSNSTFFVNPQINRLVGKLKSAISDVILSFEQKRVSNGKKGQAESLSNLNTITLLLLLSMEEMQNSNSASGYEKFMDSIEKMSNQQQGINQGTMQLGQFGMMQQKSMMQQLLEQQQKLQQQLEQLIGDNPGQETGGLTKANEDMEEVISDFKNNNINRKTYNRQQKILSRMLDSQKSLTKKDYSEKRRSKNSEDFEISTTNTIPLNYGEKDLFYINAMESALNQNLSKEYEKVTRIYFLKLQEDILNETQK